MYNSKAEKKAGRRVAKHKKKEVIAIRGYKCECCGYDKFVECHHKDCNCTNNELSNLMLLCPNCHKEVHLGLRKVR